MTANTRPAERIAQFWLVAASPIVWAVHFMLCYLTAAIWCAKLGDARGSLDPVRLAIGAYTAAALVAIVLVGWTARHALNAPGGPPQDADSAASRYRFLGSATLLLSGLSAVATVYSALVALFFRTCE